MIYIRYFLYLLRHKCLVYKFGKTYKVGNWQVLIHDIDRFLPDRFFVFAKKYAGTNYNQLEYLIALKKHFDCSPHHLEYFAFNCFTEPNSTVLFPIPEKYIREARADWSAAGFARYGNTVKEFYERYGDQMKLEDKSRKVLEKILYEMA